MLKKNLTILVTLLTGTAVCSNGDTLVATFYYAEEDFQFSDEEGGGETFDFVELPGELHFMNPGEPMMPLVNAAFAVPWGSTVNAISITASASEVLDGGYYVYPAQEQAEIGEGDVGWTPPNPAIYGSSNPYPAEVVQGGAAGTARGHMLYNFAFAPMQYRPADGEIDLYTSIEITLDYTPPEEPPEPTRMEVPEIYDMWSNKVKLVVANPNEVVTFREPVNFIDCNEIVEMELPEGGVGDVVVMSESQYFEHNYPSDEDSETDPEERKFYYPYVIITNNFWQHDPDLYTPAHEYVGDLYGIVGYCEDGRDVVKLKTRKGWPANCVTVDWIKERYTGGDVQAKIHNFLDAAYANWGTAFVLFAGDVEMPGKYEPPQYPPGETWRRSGRYGVVPIRHLCPNNGSTPSQIDEYNAPGDIYYACLDENWDGNGNGVYGQKSEVPTWGQELLVGRIALGVRGSGESERPQNPENYPTIVETEEQAYAYKAKLDKYEREPYGLSPPPIPYLDRALVVSADFIATPQRLISEGYFQGLSIQTLYEEEGTGGGNYAKYPRYPEPHNVIDKMNENFGLTFFCCHGYPFGFYTLTHYRDYTWQGFDDDPYIQITAAKRGYKHQYHGNLAFPTGLDQLENSVPGVVYALSCSTNRFDYRNDSQEDGCSEVYTLQEEHGGPLYIGFNRSPQVAPGEKLSERFLDYLFKHDTPDPNDGNPTAGEPLAWAKLEYARPDVQDEERDAAYMNDLMGDPELQIYTDDPHIFDVTYQTFPDYTPEGHLVKVTVRYAGGVGNPPVENARVCLWVRGQWPNYFVGYTNAEGVVRFLSSRTSNWVWLGVSRKNDNSTSPQHPYMVHFSEHTLP
jgi:hypothetical protein